MVEVSNASNEENVNFNSRRGIRDSPLRLSINVPENFEEFQDLLINTPSYANQMESVGSLPMNSDLINRNDPEDLRVISVHSLDTLYALSDTPIFLK